MRGQLRDLVQKQRAAIGCLEKAVACGRLRFGDPAEELGLDELDRHRGAIQRNQRCIATPARRMDRAGHQLLSGPGFALDQDGRICGRNVGD